MRQLQCILLLRSETNVFIARVRTHSFEFDLLYLTQAILRNSWDPLRNWRASGENQAVPENGLTLQELLHDRREHRSQVFLAGQLLGTLLVQVWYPGGDVNSREQKKVI